MGNIETKIGQQPSDNTDQRLLIVSSDPRIESFTITPEQLRALWLKFEQHADGAGGFEEFKRRARPVGVGSDSYIILRWCGMTLGIEWDGYTHS